MSGISEALKGPLGGWDSARILFVVGGIGVIFGPLIFQGWALILGQEWKPGEFCAQYCGGVALYLGGGGLGISLKDKGVASANATTAPSPPEGAQP